MFSNINKKLIKYFKRKEESPIVILIKLMRKKELRKIQKVKDKNKTIKHKTSESIFKKN